MTTMIKRPIESADGDEGRPDPSRPDQQACEAMSAQIRDLAARISMATARFLVLIGQFDASGAWTGHGMKSCAHWLSHTCHLSAHTAREHVRIARRLRELPLIRQEFERGALSYAKVRALTRIADLDNEADLIALAQAATAAQVERTAAGWRRTEQQPPAERADRCEVRWQYDDDEFLDLRARLDTEDGAILITALQTALARADRSRANARTEDSATDAAAEPTAITEASLSPASAAKALAEIARAYLTGQADRDVQTEVVVNVDVAVLHEKAGAGIAAYAAGGSLTPQQVREIACDTRLVTIAKDGPDILAAAGGKRTVPPALRHALLARDGGCAVPGCGEDRRFKLHAHHIIHWADDGPTELDNLVLLCKSHHRAVHHGELDVSTDAGRRTFRTAAGTVMEPAPALPLVAPHCSNNVLTMTPEGATSTAQTAHGDLFDLQYIISVLRDRHRLHRQRRTQASDYQAA